MHLIAYNNTYPLKERRIGRMAKFCTECGSSLHEDEQFCSACGTKYQASTQQAETVSHSQPQPETAIPSRTIEKKPARKMALWQKVALSLTVILLAIGIGGHFVIKAMTVADKTVTPFFNALLDNDEKAVIGNLSMSSDVKYDATAYISYIKTQNMDRFLQKLKETANAVQNDGITRVIKHEDGSELMRMKSKKFLYAYQGVEIIPITTDVFVETDLQKGKLKFNEAEHAMNGENIKLDTFLPGEYVVEATTDNALIPHTGKWSVLVTTAEKTFAIPLMKKDVMVALDGDHTDSIVYINGKSTDKTVADLKLIGPLFGSTEAVLSIQKKTPTGEMAVSAEEAVTGGSEVYFTYPSKFNFVVKTSDQIAEENFNRDELRQFVVDFRDAYEKALNSKKYAIIEPFLATDSIAAKEIKDFIKSIGTDYYDYNFTMNEVLSVQLTPDEATIKTYEEFYFTDHEYDTIFYQRDKQYAISVDQHGELKVHKITIFDTKKNR